MNIYVTIGGECFGSEFEGTGNADGRDGVLYYFKLTDLAKNRGVRNVSLFTAGTERVFIENYDARLDDARINALRRAFDSGEFSFDLPADSMRYYELRLRAKDFKPQDSASDETIRRYLKLGGYWVGYKNLPVGPYPYIAVNCSEDVDYLGTTGQALARNLWLLAEQGYFRRTALSSPGDMRVLPTPKLIEEHEMPDKDDTSRREKSSVVQNIHMHGSNPRVNVNSNDNSVNVASISNETTFVELRKAAESLVDDTKREELISRLDDLERSQGTIGFLRSYQNFIACAERIT